MDDLTRSLQRTTIEIQFARRLAKSIIDKRKADRMPRVGFRGIKKYGELTEAKLDQGADKLADRYDKLAVMGDNAFKSKHKELDGYEAHIGELEQVAAALTNGGDPLDDAAKPLNGSQPVAAESLNGAEKKTQDQDRPLQ